MPDSNENMQDVMVGFSTVLNALKKKILYIVLVMIVATSIAFQLVGPLILRIKTDLIPEGANIVYVTPLEVMMLKLRLALIIGVVATLPVLGYFILNVLDKRFNLAEKIRKKRFLLMLTAFAVGFMFVLGASYAYFIMLPLFIEYLFISAESSGAVATYSIFKFVSFAATTTVIFGFIFELPIVMTFLARSGIVSYSAFVKYRKHIYIFFLVAGALITPPDVISQIMVAIPMIIFFEISLIIVRLLGSSKSK